MEIIKVKTELKQLVIIANTEERKWIKALGENLTVEIITEKCIYFGKSFTGLYY